MSSATYDIASGVHQSSKFASTFIYVLYLNYIKPVIAHSHFSLYINSLNIFAEINSFDVDKLQDLNIAVL